jgi:hypothetical protein
MKYLCLIFIEEKKYDAMPQSEQDACVKEHLVPLPRNSYTLLVVAQTNTLR